MTRVSMNDVSIITPAYGNGGQNVSRSGAGSFQDILNVQTESGKLQEDTTQNEVSVEPEEPAKAETDRELQEPVQTERKEEAPSVEADVNNDGSEQGEEKSQEELDSVISGMLATLQQQIMDTLHISEEEFAGMLDDLGMEAVELLQSGKLSEFVLNAIGAEDSLTLLTNEGLLQDYRQVMNGLEQLLEQGSQELKISMDELSGLLETQLSQVQDDVAMEELQQVLTEELQTSAQEDGTGEAVGVSAGITGTNEMTVQTATTGENVRRDTKGEQKHQQGNQEATVFSFQNTIQGNDIRMMNQVIRETISNWAPDTQDIMNQIMDYMKIQVKPDMTNLEMQLHPASLGTVQVQLEANGDAITARFIAQNDAVRATLESQMVELKQQFQEQGVKVETIEVSVQTQTFGQSFEQGRQAEQAQEEGKPRIRRINLNDLEAMDTVETVEDADRIAMEMMNANGNTVDYMA
ncbi:MAG: flagellar hook-length control protein FliK [Lachnospiraceae bacterium]|nr:flagellar hook-length control protein FliK [Lachnospiraceae bacterium]